MHASHQVAQKFNSVSLFPKVENFFTFSDGKDLRSKSGDTLPVLETCKGDFEGWLFLSKVSPPTTAKEMTMIGTITLTRESDFWEWGLRSGDFIWLRYTLELNEMKKLLKDEGGQAIVEYVLALAMSISVVSIIAISFRKSVMLLWVSFTRDITAACPGCVPDPAIRKLK